MTFHLLMGLCFARRQRCQRRLQEGGTRPRASGQLPSLMPDARMDLGCQHQRRDEWHQRQGDAVKSSILTCWLRTSFCASSTNGEDLLPLLSRTPNTSQNCGAIAPGARGLGTQAASQQQQQKSHTWRASLPASLPPAGSGATYICALITLLTARFWGSPVKSLRTLLKTSLIPE